MPNLSTFSNKIQLATRIIISVLLIGVPAQVCAGASYPRRDAVVEAVEKVSPAVVNVSSEYIEKQHLSPFGNFRFNPHFNQFFRDFFDPGYERQFKRQNLGSGVIIDGKKGFILTNYHVIAKSGKITITLMDEREFEAQVVGADPETDLAVLRISSDAPLPAVQMGRSDDLMIGETVIAIGNPFGFSHTVTTGVISAVNRSVKTEDRVFHQFLQTDASINPGNSGGPLLNINGILIGINSAIYADAQGIGFAIPINKAKRIVADLIQYGEVIQAWTGIVVQPLDKRLARYLNHNADYGVMIKEIEADSPAAAANVREGDILLKIGGKKIESPQDYHALLKGVAAGEAIRLEIWRDGKEHPVVLKTTAYPVQNALKLAYQLLGVNVRNSSDTDPANDGVVITRIRRDSYLARIGAESGDMIRRIDDTIIHDIEDFKKAIVKCRLKSSIVLLLQRGSRGYYITVEI